MMQKGAKAEMYPESTENCLDWTHIFGVSFE